LLIFLQLGKFHKEDEFCLKIDTDEYLGVPRQQLGAAEWVVAVMLLAS
jgi:hypothetical protein